MCAKPCLTYDFRRRKQNISEFFRRQNLIYVSLINGYAAYLDKLLPREQIRLFQHISIRFMYHDDPIYHYLMTRNHSCFPIDENL